MQEQRPNPQHPHPSQPARPVPPTPPSIPRAAAPPPNDGRPRIAPMPMQQTKVLDLTPLELEDEEFAAPTAPTTGSVTASAAAPAPAPASKIRALGTSIGNLVHQENYKRPTTVDGRGAVRVRSFHGRLSDEGIVYMDSKINEWLDTHPDIEVKFATTTVGLYDGKIKEPALIVNIWY